MAADPRRLFGSRPRMCTTVKTTEVTRIATHGPSGRTALKSTPRYINSSVSGAKRTAAANRAIRMYDSVSALPMMSAISWGGRPSG